MPGGNRGRGKPGGGTRGTFNTATGIYRISGVEVAFDPELNYDVNKKPTPLFPVSAFSSISPFASTSPHRGYLVME